MGNFKEEHKPFLEDSMYLPVDNYVRFTKPIYKGKGNHSVAELENICNAFEKYCYQQQIIKQNCMKNIIELKFQI